MKSSESEYDFEQMIEMLNSATIKDREVFLREGSKFTDPVHKLLYNNELGRESYQKILVTSQGVVEHTDCPVGLLLFSEKWKVFEMTGEDDTSIFIAYDASQYLTNKWYARLMKIFMRNIHVKELFGDLVFFRPDKSLVWNELVLRRELLNWLAMTYIHNKPYKFCD
jgi:hypothetical protein